jgi:hypothetical protein
MQINLPQTYRRQQFPYAPNCGLEAKSLQYTSLTPLQLRASDSTSALSLSLSKYEPPPALPGIMSGRPHHTHFLHKTSGRSQAAAASQLHPFAVPDGMNCIGLLITVTAQIN